MDLRSILTEIATWPAEDRLRLIEQIQSGLPDRSFTSESTATGDAASDRSPAPSPRRSSPVGAMRDDADLLERITQDVMESRRGRTLRQAPDA